jgi:acyl-CoA synthetase (AMP-forming)/AMP-acid ligase II
MMPAPVSALTDVFPTIRQVMDAAVAAFGDREAYVDGDQRITFAQWMAMADALAGEFQARGVGRGDVVALMVPACIDYAVACAAAGKLGAIVTGLGTRLGRREVESIMSQCPPALVVRDEDLGLPAVPDGIAVLDRAEIPAVYRRLPVSGPPAPDGESPDDIVAILWTSGTTGLPKGATFDHRNMRAISSAAGVMSAPGDRRLVSTPFAHAGYMAKVWDQLVNGITIVVSPVSLRPVEMLQLIARERITVVGAVPTQWERMLRLAEVDSTDLSHVRIGTSATAPIRSEAVEEINRRMGFPLVVRYAMTESPTICGTEPADPPDVQFRTVGRPQLGMEVSVAAAAGEVGQVRIRGGCVMRGYWNAPELTRATFDDEGWLVSGDLGYLRADGNLAIVGRASDMYIRGGYNVYPGEVEAVLALHPAVASVSVVGTPAPRIGEIGVAFVVPATGCAPPGLEELRTLVRTELADYKAPDRLEIVGQLPVNTMLKVDKDALRELASQTGSLA